MPGPGVISPQEDQKDGGTVSESEERERHTRNQQRRCAEEPGERQCLACQQAGTDGHVMARRERREIHPAGEDSQQETEDERRQHEVLHDDRV